VTVSRKGENVRQATKKKDKNNIIAVRIGDLGPVARLFCRRIRLRVNHKAKQVKPGSLVRN
jgi:hypothetical protein